MAHKGRYYPISQRLRAWANTALWPEYFADRYIFVAHNFTGSLDPLPEDELEVEVGLFSVDEAAREFQYRAEYPYTGPELIEIGFVYQITDPSYGHCRAWCNLWVDGVPQYHWASTDIEDLTHWELLFGGLENGVEPAAVLWCTGFIRADAKPY